MGHWQRAVRPRNPTARCSLYHPWGPESQRTFKAVNGIIVGARVPRLASWLFGAFSELKHIQLYDSTMTLAPNQGAIHGNMTVGIERGQAVLLEVHAWRVLLEMGRRPSGVENVLTDYQQNFISHPPPWVSHMEDRILGSKLWEVSLADCAGRMSQA
jgi:hypothetical protein